MCSVSPFLHVGIYQTSENLGAGVKGVGHIEIQEKCTVNRGEQKIGVRLHHKVHICMWPEFV